jgi:hypothetical protein
MDLVILGPGKTTLDFKKGQEKVLAFQNVFPHCLEHLNIIPDYWVAGDPYAYILGLTFLNQNTDKKVLKDIEILVPDIFTKDLAHYRKYCGTTPLMRESGGWQRLQDLLSEASRHYKVRIFPVTTTKHIKTFENGTQISNLFEEEYVRFMSEKVVFGTVEFDNESVIGDRFKWGLENKLTSVALPVAYYLRSRKVKIYGFDYRGPRFYSDIARHPWNDETQSGNSAVEFSLSLLQKWLEWESIHQMKIYSGTKDKISLPNKILEYEG